MKNMSTMLKASNPTHVINSMQSMHSGTVPRQISHAASVLVNQLFEELQAVFPAWRHTFPNDESLDHAKKSWVKGFVDAGIKSINQIKLGTKNARASKLPHWPSVGMFVDWCKPTPEEYGLPCKEDAYREAIANLGTYTTAIWSHVAVQESVRNTTCYTLKTSSERVSRAEFYRNYSVLVNRVMCGESLKFDVPKAITEKPEYKSVSREEALNHSANLKKMVGLV